ncbi:MAG: SprB repeat-containing protein [Bacteroidetes bacterium]|nr:SprB repeat-containing protein [Bacteroidota bacterium]
MQATLQASSYNGYNISCYGMQDGTLAVNISNGTAPYSYTWSNGDTLATVSSLAAGYYAVRVRDAAGGDTTLQITLTQPEQLAIAEMTPYYYANDFNVSTYGACNGSVTTLINGGVLPLTYHWEPGQQNILAPFNLCGRENTLTVTDLNGCKTSSSINLKEPQRDDWTMTGNWGSNPADNFIGTNDNKDFVFRTNNVERMRIKDSGEIKVNTLAGTDFQILVADSNGTLKRLNNLYTPNVIPWVTTGNNNTNSLLNFIGTTNNVDFVIKTNNTEQARFTADGKLLLGTSTVGDTKFTIAHNDLNGGMSINRLSSGIGKSEIRFEQNSIELWAIGNDIDNSGEQTFFIWDHANFATRLLINKYGKVGIGVTPPGNNTTPYLLYVEGGIMTRDVKVTAATVFPDYVFAKDYELMGIYELEKYIKHNNHLPDMPSAKEVESNEGFEVGNMQTKLLKKIEEQTLYIISLQKQVDELKELVYRTKK